MNLMKVGGIIINLDRVQSIHTMYSVSPKNGDPFLKADPDKLKSFGVSFRFSNNDKLELVGADLVEAVDQWLKESSHDVYDLRPGAPA